MVENVIHEAFSVDIEAQEPIPGDTQPTFPELWHGGSRHSAGRERADRQNGTCGQSDSRAQVFRAKFCCPRCGSNYTRLNYTRLKTVKDHFPDCVSKCGNPQALRYTDHPSMAQRGKTSPVF